METAWIYAVGVAVVALGVVAGTYVSLLNLRSRERLTRYQLESQYLRERNKPESDEEFSILRQLVLQQNAVLEQLQQIPTNIIVNVPRTQDQVADWRVDSDDTSPATQLAVSGVPSRTTEPQSLASGEDCAGLIRQLSHSFNTPLSQIEAAVIAARNDSLTDAELRSALARIQGSVDVCKAFLASYRKLTRVARAASGWNPAALDDWLNDAAEIYLSALNRRDVSVRVRVGRRVRNYDNSYIASLLLPLLENAIEAAAPGSLVDVALEDAQDDDVLLHVTNRFTAAPSSSDIYREGFTTKEGHQGLGLTVVRTLLAQNSAGELHHDISADEVRFEIRLKGK